MSDHRKSTAASTKQVKETRFSMSNEELTEVIHKSQTLALEEIINCPFRNSSSSVKGKGIIELANLTKDNSELRQSFNVNFTTHFKEIVKSAEFNRNNDMSANEQMFNSFFIMTADDDIQQELATSISSHVENSAMLPVRVFLSVLQDSILKHFMIERANLHQKSFTTISYIRHRPICYILYFGLHNIST